MYRLLEWYVCIAPGEILIPYGKVHRFLISLNEYDESKAN